MAKKYLHRVSVEVTTSYILDVEAENDSVLIASKAVEYYKDNKGNPEVQFQNINRVTIYPWLEEGQEPPVGSLYPQPTVVEVEGHFTSPLVDMFQ